MDNSINFPAEQQTLLQPKLVSTSTQTETTSDEGKRLTALDPQDMNHYLLRPANIFPHSKETETLAQITVS